MSDAQLNRRIASYVAPETMPDCYRRRALCIPNDMRVIAAVNDVLAYLTLPDVFCDSSGVSSVDMQAAMSLMLFQFIDLDVDMIGAVLPFFADILPENFLWCEGQTLNRVDYPDLYSRVPSAFRLDADTFQLPDMRERFAFGASASYEVGYTGGAATHTLTVDELPAHHHAYDPVVVGDLDLEVAGAPQPNAAQIIPAVTENTYDTGGEQAHNNMPPYLALRWAIVAKRTCL